MAIFGKVDAMAKELRPKQRADLKRILALRKASATLVVSQRVREADSEKEGEVLQLLQTSAAVLFDNEWDVRIVPITRLIKVRTSKGTRNA